MLGDQRLYSDAWKPLWHANLSNSCFAPAASQVLVLFCSWCSLIICFSQVQSFLLALELEFRPDFSDLSSSSFHLYRSGPCFLLVVRMPLLCSYSSHSFYLGKKATLFYLCWFSLGFFLSCSAEYYSLYLSFLLQECCNTKNLNRKIIYWKKLKT